MRIRMHCVSSPSWMKAENLQMCHRTAKQEEDLGTGNREKVVALIQADFRGVELMAPCT